MPYCSRPKKKKEKWTVRKPNEMMLSVIVYDNKTAQFRDPVQFCCDKDLNLSGLKDLFEKKFAVRKKKMKVIAESIFQTVELKGNKCKLREDLLVAEGTTTLYLEILTSSKSKVSAVLQKLKEKNPLPSPKKPNQNPSTDPSPNPQRSDHVQKPKERGVTMKNRNNKSKPHTNI